MIKTDDVRIKAIKELLPPIALLEKFIIITVEIKIMHKNRDLEKQKTDDIRNNKIKSLLRFIFLNLAKKATQPIAKIKLA